MLQFITDINEFLSQKKRLERLFDLTNDLPSNMFNDQFKYFKSFEFDIIYGEVFFTGLKSFLNQIGDTSFSFYTILPSAENYFVKHFNKYNVAEISDEYSYEDYRDFLNSDPGNSPADCLMDNGETIAMYSMNDQWVILGSRDCEIGIVGFTDTVTQDMFINSFRNSRITSVKTRIDDLNEMLHFNGETLEFYNKLESNYKNRL